MLVRVVRDADGHPGAATTPVGTTDSVSADATERGNSLMSVPFVPLVFVVIAGAITYVAYQQRARQRAKMRAVAARHGLEVDISSKKPPQLDFDLFDVGSGRTVDAQMWRAGENDSVFQYRYTEGSGDNSRTYQFTSALIDVPFVAPHLTISSENWWSKMKQAVGLRDIELESPDFNERYQVRCPDERFAITLLDPSMIAWMLTPDSGSGAVTFEFLGPWMLCHCSQLEIDELPGMLAWAQSVRGQLPAVLAELYGR
jgi:hypothetical protein